MGERHDMRIAPLETLRKLTSWPRLEAWIVARKIGPVPLLLSACLGAILAFVLLFAALSFVVVGLGTAIRGTADLGPVIAVVGFLSMIAAVGLVVSALIELFSMLLRVAEARLFAERLDARDDGLGLEAVGIGLLVTGALGFPLPLVQIAAVMVVVHRAGWPALASPFVIVAAILSLPLAIALSVVGARLHVLGRALAARSDRGLEELSAGSFGLYLRSFAIDGDLATRNMAAGPGLFTPWRMLWNSFVAKSVEEQIAAGIRPWGPLLAIGEPDTRKSQLGAVRYWVGRDEHWKDVVQDMIARSRVVFLMPGLTEGVVWELASIFDATARAKLVVLVTADRSIYDEFRMRVDHALGLRLPELPDTPGGYGASDDIVAALRFDHHGVPTIVFRDMDTGRFLRTIVADIADIADIAGDAGGRTETKKAAFFGRVRTLLGPHGRLNRRGFASILVTGFGVVVSLALESAAVSHAGAVARPLGFVLAATTYATLWVTLPLRPNPV